MPAIVARRALTPERSPHPRQTVRRASRYSFFSKKEANTMKNIIAVPSEKKRHMNTLAAWIAANFSNITLPLILVALPLLPVRVFAQRPPLPDLRPPQFTISTIAGNGIAGFTGDGGSALNAAMNDIRGVAVDGMGNLYIADFGNNRVRKVALDGTITTVAGNGRQGYSGDGGPATSATLNQPIRVKLDFAGNLFIVDTGNNRVRKVDERGIITTVAGNGSPSVNGDNGPAINAGVRGPADVVPDSAGNLFIVEGNWVRKVDAHGIITTVAGNGTNGYSGDGGPAIKAAIAAVCGTIDYAGQLYLSDQGNNRIRKISHGIITTIAGNGAAGYSGDGGPATAAQLRSPTGTAIDAAGNLYIADAGNNRIRAVTPDGMIWTAAGNGSAGYEGDWGPAPAASLNRPRTLAISRAGGVYFSDQLDVRLLIDPDSRCIPSLSSSVTEFAAHASQAIDAKKYETAVCWLRLGADKGDANAQAALAAMLYLGTGVRPDYPQALTWAKKAAERGNYVGERCLSRMYASGRGVPKDPKLAEYWQGKAEHDKSAAILAEQKERDRRQQQLQAQRAQAQQGQFRQNMAGLLLLGALFAAVSSSDSGPSEQSSDEGLRNFDRYHNYGVLCAEGSYEGCAMYGQPAPKEPPPQE